MQAINSALDDLSEEEQQRFADDVEGFLDLPDDQNDWLRGVPSALSIALEEKFDEWSKQLSKLSYNRHTKDEASVVMSKMDSVLSIMSKVVGGVAQEIADEKAEDAADNKRRASEKAERDAAYEKERKAQRAHDDERRRMAASAQQDDSDDAFMGQHHRSNPGFAGSGNMGYGESLDRKKISKSELAQIIKEELENILK